MPLLRYFLFVGGSLLALLLAANAALPSAPAPAGLTSAADLPPVRIHSERRLPDRVVLDTSMAMPAKPQGAPVAVAQLKPQGLAPQAATESPTISAKARVREAFAQLPPEQDVFEPKMSEKMSDMATVVVPEPKMYPARQPLKAKVAVRPHGARPVMMASQQPRPIGTW